MKKSPIIIGIILSIFSSCQLKKENGGKQEYLRWVGDIEQDDQIDQVNFKVCNGDDQIFQYFNLGEGPVYEGEKSSIINTFKLQYRPLSDKDQNGFIRIRFVVNCEGKAGRYRILQSDYNYQTIAFDKRIITQLEDITKGIESWPILYQSEVAVDYYMYLIFKITEGQLTEILP